jgi:AcrR family transcriptional regulator
MHPTKRLLIETAAQLIDDFGPQGFTVETLLDRSSISKGSLYHHFVDFPDLIEQAQLKRFSRFVDEDIEALSDVLTNATSREDMLQRVERIVELSHDEARVKSRADRALIVGSSFGTAKFRKSLGMEQQRLTEAIADIIRDAQEKNWVRAEHSPRTIAMFIQAYSLGKILDDVAELPVEPPAWNGIVGEVLHAVM